MTHLDNVYGDLNKYEYGPKQNKTHNWDTSVNINILFEICFQTMWTDIHSCGTENKHDLGFKRGKHTVCSKSSSSPATPQQKLGSHLQSFFICILVTSETQVA